MARLPRLTAPGYVHHVIHRGHNKQPILRTAADFEFLLAVLRECSRAQDVAVHAYVLMPSHFHLLLTPKSAQALPLLMKELGRRYAQYFNRQHGSTGSVWEGRYRCAIIEAQTYLLASMVSLDLNPVRAGVCDAPTNYPWSSHGHYAGLRDDPIITAHEALWAMGNTPFERELSYKSTVAQGLTPQQQADITHAALRGWALGSPVFIADLAQQTPRRVAPLAPGRPRFSVIKNGPDI